MAHEIVNSLRSPSIIRVTGVDTVTVTLADLAKNANETVTSASIKRAMWSTNGSISITRNGEPILRLHNAGDMPFSEMGHTLANNATQSMTITVVTGGTLVLEVTKEATYATALEGI